MVDSDRDERDGHDGHEHQDVDRAEGATIDRSGLSPVSPGDHRQIHLFGERVGLAEGCARGRGDERASTRQVVVAGARALRASYMSVIDVRRWKRYRYASPSTKTNARGTRSARSAARSRGQGVVTVSRTTTEIEVATRMTMRPAAVRPCAVKPTGVPNHVPSGTTMWPGVMTLSAAGSATTPVNNGTKSHTRRTRSRAGTCDADAASTVAA